VKQYTTWLCFILRIINLFKKREVIGGRSARFVFERTPYILSFCELRNYCSNNADFLLKSDGNCKHCLVHSNCLSDNRNEKIHSILSMEQKESRFPSLLSAIQKHPGILDYIPAWIYEKAYGKYHNAFPCPFNAKLIINNLDQIEAAYDMLSDVYSRMVYLNVIMYRLTMDSEYILRAYSQDPQYFIQGYRGLGKNEVFVDCGAFIGDSFQKYCYYNSPPRCAYLFEPDLRNIEKINLLLKNMNLDTKVELIKKGVFSQTGNMYFQQDLSGEGSRLTNAPSKADKSIEVTSIDDSIDDEVTFIKMDIEGSEMAAIEGAKKHIAGSYPKLAICLYHKISDLWEIPLKIHQLFPQYNNYVLRHHRKISSETVIYVYR